MDIILGGFINQRTTLYNKRKEQHNTGFATSFCRARPTSSSNAMVGRSPQRGRWIMVQSLLPNRHSDMELLAFISAEIIRVSA